MYELLAVCLAGLEDVVVQDIKDSLPHGWKVEVQVLTDPSRVDIGEALCGKILLRSERLPTFLQVIRSVQFWTVHVFHEEQLAVEATAVQLQLEERMNIVDLESSYAHWKEIVTAHTSPPDAALPTSPTFCARCIRSGSHKYNSVELSKVIGSAVYSKTQWAVSMKDMTVEVLCVVAHSHFYLGLLLPIGCRPAHKSHLPSECKPPMAILPQASKLRSSTAYLLAKLAQPQPHEVLIDCMCGNGTILVEGAVSYKCLSLGGDADPSVASSLKDTLDLIGKASGCPAPMEGLLWSAKYLPVRDAVADIIIADLPFSKLGNHIPKYQWPRPGQVVLELARTLVPGKGRCVLLAQTSQQLTNCLNSIYFHSIKSCPVNIGGYVACIITAWRTEQVFQAQPILRHLEESDGRLTFPKKRPAPDSDV